MTTSQELHDDMDRLTVAVLRVKAERDSLLAALKCAVPVMVGALAFTDCNAELKLAKAAIAKAEGK